MNDHYAFIYSGRFGENGCTYGSEHPFKILRYRLAYDLIAELGLLSGPRVTVVDSSSASEEALLTFHRRDYLETLKEFSRDPDSRANFFFGLGDVENPVFPGLYDWSRLACGGTLEAVRQVVDEGRRLAFNMAGGWHHAHPARASGFSYLNDATVAIQGLVKRGLRVAYVDIDAHHGDGVQEAFYGTDRVLTISLHEWGKDFFPQTGSVFELGTGKGYGYSVNVPFLPHTDDLVFEQAFNRIVLPLLSSYNPDVLVTQLGVDALRKDPLTRLELTTGSFESAARSFLGTGLPWVALGGGGYDKINVALTWALVWAVMIGQEVGDTVPPRFGEAASRLGVRLDGLRDPPHLAHPDDFARAQESLDRTLRILEKKLLSLHGVGPGGPR